MKGLATTYSRGTYRTTTIGNAVFDGRVREGIGSGTALWSPKIVLRYVKSVPSGCEGGVRCVYTQGLEG